MSKKNKIIIEPPRVNSFKQSVKIEPFKNRKKNIKSVRLVKINLDDEYKKDIESGKGFDITNENDFDKKTGNRTIDGLQSPKYGVDTFTDKSCDDAFHCECGELVGGINDGEICPNCGTKVQFVDADLSRTGYISLKYEIINPAMYTMLEKLIGKKDLQSIIKFSNKFNIDGKINFNKTKSSPYSGLGLIRFRKYFDEIIEFYRNKKKREDAYEDIIENRDNVFTSHIAVYSSLLRPLIKEDSKFSMFEANKSFAIILSNANIIINTPIIDDESTVIIDNCLYEIQSEYNKICKDLDAQFSGKKGILRSVISTRVDESGRAVVKPQNGLFVNEVSMPYAMGVELMRPLLIKALTSIDDINVRIANTIIDDGLRKFDKKLWILMNHILKDSKNPPMLLIQRSPSLLQESMRLMDIREIKCDIKDLTLGIPIGICKGMNADFDGDTFACYMIFDNRIKASWKELFSPKHNFISRHDAMCNTTFIKDSAVILTELWEVGKNGIYYDNYADERELSELANRLMKEDESC